MSCRLLRLSLTSLMICTFMRADAQTSPSVTPQVWSPPPALVARLGPAITLDNCALRLPAGYTLYKTTIRDQGRKEYVFAGPRQPDNWIPFLLVTTGTKATTLSGWTPDAALRNSVSIFASGLNHPTLSSIQTGSIDQLQALRCYGKGEKILKSGRRVEMHFFEYVAGTPGTNIEFIADDITPYSSEAMPLMEASVLTMRTVSP